MRADVSFQGADGGMATDQTEWIAVDWGTTHLRTWVYGPGGALRARLASDDGMGRLAPGDFEPALLNLVAGHLPEGGATPVLCCGMVGARQGWAEAAYVAAPCAPPGLEHATRAPTADPRLDVRLLPGVSQQAPADVIRGEETQIAGLLAENPGLDGVICLPGTHTKWVRVRAGEIVAFRSFMTGELFTALRDHTVLRHSVGDGHDEAAFLASVAEALRHPEALTSRLFGLRAEGLLHGLDATTATSRLSGLLVGLELAGARDYWQGQHVTLVGSAALTGLYETALAAQAVQVDTADGEAMVLAGLGAAWAGFRNGRTGKWAAEA